MTVSAPEKYLTDATLFGPAADDWALTKRILNSDGGLLVLQGDRNLSDVVDPAIARMNLGLQPGIDVQPFRTSLHHYGLGPVPSLFTLSLMSNTTAEDWARAIGVGTVKSIAINGGTTGLMFTGGPITDRGTISMIGTLQPSHGGTGASSLLDFKANLALNLVNNTTDADKPISNAAQLKFDEIDTVFETVTLNFSEVNDRFTVVESSISNLTANDIQYDPSRTVFDVLASLTYSVPEIATMSVSPTQVERGASVNVTVTWTVTGSITAQTLEGTSIDVAVRSQTFNNVTASNTYDLVVTDGDAPDGPVNVTRTAAITLMSRRYWGISSQTTLTSAQIVALASSELNNTRAKTLTLDGGVSPGSYLYYAYPASLGNPTSYKIYGFDEDPVITTVSVTTAAGATLNYTVLRSPNMLTGSASVEIG